MACRICAQRAGLRHLVVEAVIDLVGDEPHVPFRTRCGNVGQRVGRQHGAGGVGRACQQQPVQPLVASGFDLLVRGCPAAARINRQVLHANALRLKNVPVGRVAGHGQAHLVACIETGREAQHERGRRAGGDGNVVRAHADAIGRVIVGGNALAKRQQAKRVGVAHVRAVECGTRGLDHLARRPACRLSCRHVHHVMTGSGQRIGLAEEVHDDERLHPGSAVGRFERHQRRIRQLMSCASA
jgi:hypothetical protein